MAGCFPESWTSSPFWNIFLLALAWALTLSTSTLLTTVGPLSAAELGASKSLSAFTIGVFLIGAAISSVPSGWLFRKYGRYCGFSLGCMFQLIGSALGVLSLATNQLFWLYLGCLSVGLAQGLGQFYRFSAVEVTPKELKSRAVTYVLSGGIIAAFLGPTSANYTIDIIGEQYMGSYFMIAAFALLNQLVISMVNFPPRMGARDKDTLSYKATKATPVDNNAASNPLISSPKASVSGIPPSELPIAPPPEEEEEIRTTWQIVLQPQFILSCTIATLAHTIMVMLMSNVTVDMKDNGYSFQLCSIVMELHFFAMFAPGFITGKLIEKHGSFAIAMVGGFIFAGSSAVFAAGGGQTWNYFLGMILLGIAWNFAFSAGTVMLTGCYRPKEATEVQAVNDFVLFSVAGAGSLLSGEIFAIWGWLYLVYVASGLMFLYLLLFAWALGRVTTIDTEASEPLIAEKRKDRFSTPALERAQRLQQEVRHNQYSADGSDKPRTLSFSQRVLDAGRTVSFSLQNDPTSELVDEQTPLRTQSVA